MSNQQERFWAKTGETNFQENVPYYHPVICHLADTAAVAMAIVRDYLSPLAITTLEAGLGLSGESLIKCCGFLAGCHDLGKVSPVFQFQRGDLGKALIGSEIYDGWLRLSKERRAVKAPHGTITAATLPDFLIEVGLGQQLTKKLSKRLARRLAAIVGGHHGFFPSDQEINSLDTAQSGADERSVWRKFSRVIFEQLRDFVGLTTEDLPNQCGNGAAMLLAGLTTVSDWIASNADFFPYADSKPFNEYSPNLAKQAKTALTAMGWAQVVQGKTLTFAELFPEIKNSLRPLQEAAIQLSENLQPPCLILMEASMGEGKTEAALYLADYLQHGCTAGGFYLGLPTQATSNAMWLRVKNFLRQRYPENVVNLTLSHSAAALKTDYLDSVCRLDQVYDNEGKVAASEWHTARKRTLLSPYGVGTIDQGLMGVVRSRHQFVRLFGLAGKVVILDEIHAYDLYTSTLLERFLEWLALLGSPVIALSATLPKDIRSRLLKAYAKGCGYAEPILVDGNYPRITTLTKTGVNVLPFVASEHVRRSLKLKWVTDEAWPLALKAALVKGGCAAVICSTVNRAQEVYQQLQDYFAEDEMGLFHGRFLYKDRERIEGECLEKFGKTGVRPYRYVLVATQVVEQSLDIDFDVMITDLAPIDLLLQRSGRLHRHHRLRPVDLEEPTLWIIEPTFEDQRKVNFGASRYIYERHILLRSWLTLRNKNTILLPEETDKLLEEVYDIHSEIPEGMEQIYAEDWQTSLVNCQQEMDKQATIAREVQLPPAREESTPDKFTRDKEGDDESAIAAVTRLGKPSVTTIFLQQTQGDLILPISRESVRLENKPDLPQIRELLAHSTRISSGGLVPGLLALERPNTWTSALLRSCRYIVLDSQGVTQVGDWEVSLDEKLGVVIKQISKE